MPRVDIWEVKQASELPAIDCGFARGLEDEYEWGDTLGKGGFGKVSIVTHKATGKQYACKSIAKHLDIPNLSQSRRDQHVENIKREIAVLLRLRGTLNVAQIKKPYEDDVNVHIVMELCRGGELWHRIGKKHYSERTVASFMRAVLRTIAQCHTKNILHRDIKPGNFMLLSDDERAPVKAIDFGLAVFFSPDKLPRTDLGLDGTAWFMAPEVLSSQVWPTSDVWAAGVMAYQLLSGYLPFDDHRNPNAPALSIVWRSILTEEPSFKRSVWKDISDDAKDFVKTILNKDHTQRPSALEALKHRWLSGGNMADRSKGTPLRQTVVQRIQRYAGANLLQRTIFELMAQELIKMMPRDGSVHNGSLHGGILRALQSPGAWEGSQHGPPGPPQQGPAAPGIRKRGHSPQVDGADEDEEEGRAAMATDGPGSLDDLRDGHAGSAGGSEGSGRRGRWNWGGSESVHGGSYWRVMRASLAAGANKMGGTLGDYLHTVGRSETERGEHRKAARLCLDTSVHAAGEYSRLAQEAEQDGEGPRRTGSGPAPMDVDGAQPVQAEPAQPAVQQPIAYTAPKPGTGALSRLLKQDTQPSPGPSMPRPAPSPLPTVPSSMPAAKLNGHSDLTPAAEPAVKPSDASMEVGRRGAYLAFLEASGANVAASPAAAPNEAPLPPLPQQQQLTRSDSNAKRVSFGIPTELPEIPEQPLPSNGALEPRDMPPSGRQPQGLAMPVPAVGRNPKEGGAGLAGVSAPARFGLLAGSMSSPNLLAVGPGASLKRQAEVGGSRGKADGGAAAVALPLQELRDIMRKLQFTRESEGVAAEALLEGLRRLGYQLTEDEANVLLQGMDTQGGVVDKSAFVASQLDWQDFQTTYREAWLECARRAFAGMDADSDGSVRADELLRLLRGKLPETEVEWAVEDALVDAGYADAEEVDFEGFLSMLKVGSLGSLDQYESRLRAGGHGSSDSLQALDTQHGGELFSPRLTTVQEEAAARP